MQLVFASEAQCYVGKELDNHARLLLLEHNCKRVETKVQERHQSTRIMDRSCHPARECLPNLSMDGERWFHSSNAISSTHFSSSLTFEASIASVSLPFHGWDSSKRVCIFLVGLNEHMSCVLVLPSRRLAHLQRPRTRITCPSVLVPFVHPFYVQIG